MVNPCTEFRPVVLIAQSDIQDLQVIVEASLQYDKYDIVTATTGQEIVDKINSTCFDAVIMGLRFPDLTGSTLAYLIHDFNPLIKIGFLTHYHTKSLIHTVENLNCVFFNKTEELKDLNGLCEKIYKVATEIPCSDKIRAQSRELNSENRLKYTNYNKLFIPIIMGQAV